MPTPPPLIADFQATVAARVEAGDIDGHLLAFIAAALQQAKIPVSAELSTASEKQIAARATSEPGPADVGAAIVAMLDACGGDPFALVGSLTELGHAMPAETRDAIASSLALSGIPGARSAAVLLALDPDPQVRRSAAEALGQAASSLSPTDVRRLIAMRNWRPESERSEIDVVIRRARAAGIGCAQWEAGTTETILASAVDGAASQGFRLVSPAGRKKRLSSILTKGGIADAWSGALETRRQIDQSLADASMGMPMLEMPRSYLDRAVTHHLALGIEKARVPPLGLLQVAETLGGADWQPARMDFGETLAALVAEIPKPMREPAFVRMLLRDSDGLADLDPISKTWFEDDSQVADVMRSGRGAGREKLATYLLQSVIARRREKWAELLLWTALWLRAVSGDLCWRELVIVVQAIAGGRDLSDIGLMRDVALRTIAALGDASPVTVPARLSASC